MEFQSTRPRGRTRHDEYAEDDAYMSFNPRVLAGGRDKRLPVEKQGVTVSIHASSREDAT